MNEISNKRIEKLEVWFYIILVLISLAMRFWDLGSRSFGYDESLHAYYSYLLYQGDGFQHTPLMHGPLQFHGTALMFFLFGDSDYTARLLHAILGTLLVILPFFLRDRMGRIGALVTAFMIAFSPMMLYYSRYARNDILMAFWTTSLVILMWRYLDTGRSRYIYLSALVLALSFATKETTFISLLIVCSYLFIISSTDWIPWLLRKPALRKDNNGYSDEIGPNSVGVVTIEEYRYWPGYGYFYGKPNFRHRMSNFSNAGSFLVLLVTLSVPQVSAVSSLFQSKLAPYGVILADSINSIGSPSGDILFNIGGTDISKGIVIATVIIILLLWFSALIGFIWNRKVWIRSATIFYGVWILLFTTVFTNLLGIGSGVWQSLGYWIVQHEERRGDQPWYYYLVVTPIYETLPFVLSLIAIAVYICKGNRFTRFLVYWTVLTFIMYSWAGEKMPWLAVNIAVPMIFLSGKLIDTTISSVNWRELGIFKILEACLLTLGSIYFVVKVLILDTSGLGMLEVWGLSLSALVIISYGLFTCWRLSPSNALKISLLSISGLLFLFGFRTAWDVSYNSGDVPTEMIVYAQGSPEAKRIISEINNIATRTGHGHDLMLSVDRDIYWGLLWYIREYKNVDYLDMHKLEEKPEGFVLLASDSNDHIASKYSDEYTDRREFLYMWWPSEGYKPCRSNDVDMCLSVKNILTNLSSSEKWKGFLDYYIFRRTDAPFLFHEAVAYFEEAYEQ